MNIQPAGLDLREGRQVTDQPAQVLDLGFNDLDALGGQAHLTVFEHLHVARKDLQGRAQIVSDIGGHALALLIGLHQIGAHLIEGGGELAQLVLGSHRELLLQFAARQGLRGCCQALDGAREAPRKHKTHHHRRQHPRQGSQPDGQIGAPQEELLLGVELKLHFLVRQNPGHRLAVHFHFHRIFKLFLRQNLPNIAAGAGDQDVELSVHQTVNAAKIAVIRGIAGKTALTRFGTKLAGEDVILKETVHRSRGGIVLLDRLFQPGGLLLGHQVHQRLPRGQANQSRDHHHGDQRHGEVGEDQLALQGELHSVSIKR